MKTRSYLSMVATSAAAALLVSTPGDSAHAHEDAPAVVSRKGLQGKVLCGYQGWFRCPGDASALGWIHWSRDTKRLAPETFTFEMWPDMREYTRKERFAAPGFTYPDGRQAELFSSDHPATVLRHFRWMKEYDIDGAWLQHFVVDLPGGPSAARYPSRMRVLEHVRSAARNTGRVWALSYDIAGMPRDRHFETLTTDWKRIVDAGITGDSRYLEVEGRPVVQSWGFYQNNAGNAMTAELARQLIQFFHASGKYGAYLVGGGDWDWRNRTDGEWQDALARLDAYIPWNVGNFSRDEAGSSALRPTPGSRIERNAPAAAFSGSRRSTPASVGTTCSAFPRDPRPSPGGEASSSGNSIPAPPFFPDPKSRP